MRQQLRPLKASHLWRGAQPLSSSFETLNKGGEGSRALADPSLTRVLGLKQIVPTICMLHKFATQT